MISLSRVLEADIPYYNLIQLLHPTHFRPESIPYENWDQIIGYAEQMHVIPLLFYILKQNQHIQPPTATYDSLLLAYLTNGGRNLTLTNELSKILKLFDTNAIPVIPLKGAYLAHTVYELPSLRYMMDIDLLVKWEDITKSITILESLGYSANSSYHLNDECHRYDHHGPGFIHPSGTKVELHWNISDTFSVGERGRELGEKLWLLAQPGVFLETKAYVLPPEILIFHCAIHQTIQHAFNLGIREFFDIERIYLTYRDEIDWNYLISFSREMKFERPVLLTLALTDLITGSHISDELKKNGYIHEIPDRYLIDAVGEIARGGKAKDVSFRIAQTNPGLLKLIQSIVKRVFLCPETMEIKYQIPADSPRIYLYYPYRFYDLVTRLGPGLFREYWSLSKKTGTQPFWEWIYAG